MARGDVRLILSVRRDSATGYELVHERLIPAVRKIASKELSEADRAAKRLDQRVNEWLANNRKWRYLLSLGDWWLIRKQMPHLAWGVLRSQKEDLLSRSVRRFQVFAGLICFFFLTGTLFYAWWNSSFGQIYQVRRDLANLSGGINDSQILIDVASSLAITNSFHEAHKVVQRIDDPLYKVEALVLVAEATARRGDRKKVTTTLDEAHEIAKEIDYPRSKVEALEVIAAAKAKGGEKTQAIGLLEEARQVAETEEDDLEKAEGLGRVAKAAAKIGATIGDRTEELALLHEALQSVDRAEGASSDKCVMLSAIVEAATKVEDRMRVTPLLQHAKLIIEGICGSSETTEALGAIAEAAAASGDSSQAAAALREAEGLIRKLDNSPVKFDALRHVAWAAATIGDSPQAATLFEQAFRQIEKMRDPLQADAVVKLAGTAAGIGAALKDVTFLYQALRLVERIHEPYMRTVALVDTVEATAKVRSTVELFGLLGKAYEVAGGIKGISYRTQALEAIAKAAGEAGKELKNVELLDRARTIAEAIANPYAQCRTLVSLASSAAKIGYTKEAGNMLHEAQDTSKDIGDSEEADALIDVAEGAARIGKMAWASRILQQAGITADAIQDSSEESKSLSAVADAATRIGDKRQAMSLVLRAFDASKEISGVNEDFHKFEALRGVALSATKIGNLRIARSAALLNNGDADKIRTLSLILETWAQRKAPASVEETPD